MCDFHFTPVEEEVGFTKLQRGDHVAWKHSSPAGRVYYHHAIVEAVHNEDGFVNVIAQTKEGVGRCVIDKPEGLHLVEPISTPAKKTGGIVSSLTSWLPGSSSSGAGTETPLKTAESADDSSCTSPPADEGQKRREEVYARAKKMIGTKGYDPQKNNCETFAFYVHHEAKQEEPYKCPMCQTTGHNTKIFS